MSTTSALCAVLLMPSMLAYIAGSLLCPIGYVEIKSNRKHIITFLAGVLLVAGGIAGAICCTIGLAK